KLYEHVSKTCSWLYPKFTPSGYIWKPKSGKENVNPNLIEIILFIIDSRCSKHMTRNLKLLINFVEKFLGTVKFGNDQIAPILGYGDLVQGAVTIKRVYYVEGLNHNLFSVDLYSITLQDTNYPNLICLMAKVTSSQAWLWYRRLSHLNFDTINLLSKNDIVVGLPKLKFIKDHLCSSCELGKAKRTSFHTKLTPSSKEVVSKSFAVSAADAPNQRQQQQTTSLVNHTTPEQSCQVQSHELSVTSNENINQAKLNAENDQVANDELINIFSTPVQDQGETSSCHVDSLNMQTFYQRYPSEHRWTKDHPLEQIIGNPSQSIRTRRQLELNAEMCMFALTMSRTEPKNIKEAMADSTWIESMQEELH
nr:hypothetical protein [Tanacetum cinerariifolium]